MKRIPVWVAVLLLSGCGTLVPMEELERQAFLTGDWSAVEARERTLVRQNMRRGMQCPSGYTGYCETSFGRERCACVERDVVRVALSSR